MGKRLFLLLIVLVISAFSKEDVSFEYSESEAKNCDLTMNEAISTWYSFVLFVIASIVLVFEVAYIIKIYRKK